MSPRSRSGEAGASAVELALISPVLILLLFGIIVFGWTFFRAQSMQSAVREGGRLAAVGIDQSTIENRMFNEQWVAGDTADLVIGFNRNGTAVPSGETPCRDEDRDAEVEVTIGLVDPSKHQLWIPLWGPVGPDYSYQAVFRCE